MKLLICTQAIDANDPVLGFFHRWVEALAPAYDLVEVICLKSGAHHLPENVRVHSLGKEYGKKSRGVYALRFLALIWRLRGDYDAVFVHMNQEYILLAGWLWLFLGKPVYFWRNHYAGSFLTTIAASFCAKVFCTSKHSYTARYANTVAMPVGVDTERFHEGILPRISRSILFLARMMPAKRPDMLLDAFAILKQRGVEFSADFVGSPAPQDLVYYTELKHRGEALGATFIHGVPNHETPALYQTHHIFVNCSPSGMYDKTLFEAAACGAFVLAASDDFAALAGEEHHFATTEELAEKLEQALLARSMPVSFIADHSLTMLATRLVKEMDPTPRRARTQFWEVLALIARLVSTRPRMTILLYHSISNSPDRFAVSPEAFAKQMAYLAAHAEVVPLARAFAHAAGEPVARDSVAITFDDGYRDFLTEALPILIQHGFSSTVFVIGGDPDRHELDNEHPLLGRADRDALTSPLVAIGSHAASHKKLTKLDALEVRSELEHSRIAIREAYGVVPEYLAYPKGSYNETVMTLAEQMGYRGAVTVVERSVRVEERPYALPRVQVDATTNLATFKAKLVASDLYYWLWRLIRQGKIR